LWAHARQQQHFFAFLSFFLLCLCDSFGMFSLKKTLLCPAHRYKLNIFVWKAKRIKAVHCSSSILYNTRHSSGHGAKLRGIRDDRIPSIKSTFGERGKIFSFLFLSRPRLVPLDNDSLKKRPKQFSERNHQLNYFHLCLTLDSK
jgi:hypothetical protein